MVTTVKNDSSRIRKKIRYTVGIAVRIFPATMRNFTKDTELLEHGRGEHGMCELARHGMAGARQGRDLGTAWYV